MARGNPHGYLTKRSPKPATQNFEGENAGGCGTYGLMNTGKDYNIPYDADGSLGKNVSSGDASGTAKRLISESTGMDVEGGVPGSAFPKP